MITTSQSYMGIQTTILIISGDESFWAILQIAKSIVAHTDNVVIIQDPDGYILDYVTPESEATNG